MKASQVRHVLIGLPVVLALAACTLLHPQMPTPAATPTTTPTPMAFAPADESRPLIIVADLGDQSEGKYGGPNPGGGNPAQYIYEHLESQARADRLRVRIERLPQVVDEYTVQSVAQDYAATLVLWGWYDASSVMPMVEQRGTRENPGRSIAFCPLTYLPNQAVHWVAFTLGVSEYVQERYEQALEYLADDAVGFSDCAVIYNQRGLIYRALGAYDTALTEFSRALELDPENPRFYNDRGDTFALIEEYNASRADYARAMELSVDIANLFD
jgi:tetratricopeptide (TPR) repeat protein